MADRRSVDPRSLRLPRGRYVADRASQLSGVPVSTIYYWHRVGVYRSDYPGSDRRLWSYRDLVLLRALAWMRSKGMVIEVASERASSLKGLMTDGQLRSTVLRSGRHTFIGDEDIDRVTGQTLLEGLGRFLDEFDLAEPIGDGEAEGPTWGPNLVEPTPRTFISPWIMNGDPCINKTRITTSSLFALNSTRGLVAAEIVRLYPATSEADVQDAIDLEVRLRRSA